METIWMNAEVYLEWKRLDLSLNEINLALSKLFNLNKIEL